MQINITVLYPDLFNHYGDAGNIIVLTKRLEVRKIKVNLNMCNSACDIDLKNTDILYIGGATDRSIAAVYKEIYSIKDKIKEYAENGGVILAVCTGFEMLGKSFETESEKFEGLGVLSIHATKGSKRLIGNIVTKSETLGFDIVGFENHIGRISLAGHTPLGSVVCGYGNTDAKDTEGVIYKNVIGTYIHGPVLPKNPMLADYILKCALGKKYGETNLESIDDKIETIAHNYVKEKYVK